MSRYSSDSDSSSSEDSRKRVKSSRSKGRSRSSSNHSSSSDSHYSSQKKSSKHKRSRRPRSRSPSRHAGRKKHKHRSRSTSRSRRKNRSRSRDRNHKRRSPSWDRSKARARSSSHDSPSVPAVRQEPSTAEQLQAKLAKAMKAAQTADELLRQQGLLPAGTVVAGAARREEPEAPRAAVLAEINDAGFAPKAFSSTKAARMLVNIPVPVVDLATDAAAPVNLDEPASLFHSSLFVDPKEKHERWVQKLYRIRQKAINGEPITLD